jgi:hypothetical protein
LPYSGSAFCVTVMILASPVVYVYVKTLGGGTDVGGHQ